MREAVELVLATEKDAELLHQMKYEAFFPLYEIYHDDETSPVKEPMEKVIRCIQMDNSDYYLIKFQNEFVGGIRIVEKQEGVFSISPMFILPEYQNKGIGYTAIQTIIGVILCGHDGRRGFIYHTAVHVNYRNQGIARSLVKSAIQGLEEEGINKVALVVFGENKIGNAFWDKLGFSDRLDLVYRNKGIREFQRIDTSNSYPKC